MPAKNALITGICGQDGRYLSDLLVSKGYEVHGTIASRAPGVGEAGENLFYWDLSDGTNLQQIFKETQPDEVYNLAAQSHVRVSFDLPVYTAQTVYMGALRLLESVRRFGKPGTRLYQASSSEMFGGLSGGKLNEDSPFMPRSPYAVAKVAAFQQTVNYREAYGLFASNGILFNHESERRGKTFVTRKITHGIAKILSGSESYLYLGNLAAQRDWGHAADYVRAMWMVLQNDEPDDFCIATGRTHTVRSFLETCCGLVDIDPDDIVRIDQRYFRPTEVDHLLGDASKAKRVLGWEPQVSFEDLCARMLAHDLREHGIDLSPYGKLRDLAADPVSG